MKIIVIGTGQSLRGDDAAGLEAVRLWREMYPQTANRPEVWAKTVELIGLGLLDLLAEAEAAIIVDAVHSSAPAGTIHRLSPEQVSAFTPDSQFAHGWGLAETLALCRTLYSSRAECRLTLIGIEAGQVEMGAGLSLEVGAALPAAARLIEEEVQQKLAG